MSANLVDLVREIVPTGPDGFEGLIARLLEVLTGQHFRLARSGSQAGRDMSMRHPGCNVVAVECKRYGKETKLGERELLGELVQAVRDIPDLDLWVLIASRSISSQLQEALQYQAEREGIGFLSISADDGMPSSLDVLCAQSPQALVEPVASCDKKQSLLRQVDKITASPQFMKRTERMREELLSPSIGYDNWRVAQNEWFVRCLESEVESRSTFGQPLNVEEKGVGLVPREAAWAQLDEWLSGWAEKQEPFLVLGEEGDGKTWAVASWLNRRIQSDEGFPPVAFLSSINVDSNDPLSLLSSTVSRRLRTLRPEDWEKRFNRWSNQKDIDGPVLLLILDGINERRKSAAWRALLENLAAEPWARCAAVLITCRTAYWDRYFAPLRHIEVTAYTLPPYDDNELDKALEYHHLRRSEIARELLPLIRKPRYFDLMVKHRKRMIESGDFTVARLVYEDWRDRLQRKRLLDDLNDEAFQDLVRELARKNQEGKRYVNGREIERCLPSYSDRQAIIQELRSGGILRGRGNRYEVDKRLLIYGFGLLLVDQLEQAASDDIDLQEALAEWLEPNPDMDIKAHICEFAALHALSVRGFPREAKVALLEAWVNSHNPKPETDETFSAYLPMDPLSYIKLAETVWSDASENSWAQELLMHSFLRWRDSGHVRSALVSACERWLGFVHLRGFPHQRGKTAEEAEEIHRAICDRVGCQLQPGPFEFVGYSLTAIEDDGLLRLGRAALAVISHLPRGPFVRAIASGCVGEAVMGCPDKYELFRWVMKTAPQPLWDEVEEEVQQLLAVNHVVAGQAAHRLLSFEGSEQAHQLQRILPKDLFPVSYLHGLHKKDPCTSGFAWSQGECEMCVQRTDLEPQWIARSLKPHCVNPNLSVPSDLETRLAPLMENVSASQVWSSLGSTKEDIHLEQCEPALCAFAPQAIAGLVRRVTQQVEKREGFPLRQLAFRLVEHYLVLDQENQNSVYGAWARLSNKPDSWSEAEKVTEWVLFAMVLRWLSAEEQLLHLLRRPNEALDLATYEESFRATTCWETVWRELSNAPDSKAMSRILWFLSAHPESVPRDSIHTRVLPLLSHEDSFVRSLVLQILYASESNGQVKELIAKGPWAWSPVHSDFENRWGSRLLCRFGHSVPYDELRCRVYPIYLGFAVRCRGMRPIEVEHYAEDIHHLWLAIHTKGPGLPSDFPLVEVDASITEDQHAAITSRRGLSPSEFSKSLTFVSRNATWGGVSRANPRDWLEDFQPDASELQQKLLDIMRQSVDEQVQAGNLWFARRFYTDALTAVLEKRPDLVDKWLGTALQETPEAVRVLTLGRSFYEALCSVLLHHAPAKGVCLYWRLKEVGGGFITLEADSRIQLLDYTLFQAPSTEETRQAWKRKLEQCHTDRELMQVAIVAQAGRGREWLWSYVERRVRSPIPLERSRSRTLLAFIEGKEALDLLSELISAKPAGWMKSLLQMSLQRWQLNDWAKHWFRKFLQDADDVIAWASFRLFLKCVDTRFWRWREQIEAEATLNVDPERRRAFLEANLDGIRKVIRKNEKPLRESFLGQKVRQNQAWPWM